MEIRYERDLTNAYMVMPAGEEAVGYPSRMVLENRIRGFLPVQKRCRDEHEEYYYCISSQVSLEEYLDHTPLRAGVLKQLIFTLYRAVASLGEYLLTEEYLLLTPETIFVQENRNSGAASDSEEFSGTFALCIYPDEKQDVKESLRQLMKYLMGKTNPAEENCAALCYELYGMLQKDNFCIQEFMTLLEHTGAAPAVPEPEKKKWSGRLFAPRRNSGILSM